MLCLPQVSATMTVANGTNGTAHQGNNNDLNIDAPRFEGVVRPYSDADVAKLQGSLKIEHTLANEGAKKLWVRCTDLLQTGTRGDQLLVRAPHDGSGLRQSLPSSNRMPLHAVRHACNILHALAFL